MAKSKLPMCRICFIINVKHVVEPRLQETYEKLTAMPFQTNDIRPLTMCYVCHAQLTAARRFMLKCQKAEELLSAMVTQLEATKNTHKTSIIIEQSGLSKLTISSIEQINIESTIKDPSVAFKKPLMLFYEDDLELGIQSNQGVSERANSDKEPENTPSVSDTIDNMPLNNIDANVETVTEHLQEEITENDLKPDVPETTIGDADAGNTPIVSDIKEDIPLNNIEGNLETVTEHLLEEINSIDLKPDVPETVIGDTEAENTPSVSDTKDDIPLNNIDDNVETATEHLQEEIADIKQDDPAGFDNTPNASDAEHDMCDDINETANTVKEPFQVKIAAIKLHKWKPVATDAKKIDVSTPPTEDNTRVDTCSDNVQSETSSSSSYKLNDGKRKRSNKINESQMPANDCTDVASKTCLKNNTLDREVVVRKRKLSFSGGESIIKNRVANTKQLYTCDVCEKKYKDKKSFIEHVKSHTGAKRYVCNVCNKSLDSKRQFQVHERKHTGVMLYSCDICKRGFNYKLSLQRHALTHTDERAYSCNVCDKRFKGMIYLKRHELKHKLTAKPYLCDVCKKRFGDEKSFHTHIFQIHGVLNVRS